MGLDIFFIEDIQNALLAANTANGLTAMTFGQVLMPQATAGDLAAAMPALRGYQVGYRAALVTIALAFGIPPAILNNKRDDRCDGLSGL